MADFDQGSEGAILPGGVDVTGLPRTSAEFTGWNPLASICSTPQNGVGWYRNTKPGPWDATSGCIDWQQMQWEASFKDIPFCVESDTRTGGRRIQVHEYPSKENWDNEDLGRLRQQATVEGYVYGDRSDEWAEQLFAACTSPTSEKSSTGRGMLYLPMRVPLWAFCQSVESTFQASQMGRIDFTMSFSIETEIPTGNMMKNPTQTGTQLTNEVYKAASEVTITARQQFETDFTGTQPATARSTAAETIRRVADGLGTAAKAIRLNDVAASVIDFITSRLRDNADGFADAQSTSVDKLAREAAVLSGTTSKLSYYNLALQGRAIRASTGEILPALGNMAEGFGGFMHNAFGAMAAGNDRNRAADLAQALIPLSQTKPRILRALSAAQLTTASVQDELALAEMVSAMTRRMALAQSILAGTRVAPSKQPDASLARADLLSQIDDELALLPTDSRVANRLRRLRTAVVKFIDFYSVNGSGTVSLPKSWTGKPLSVVAASVYGTAADGKDLELMQFNGLEHPMFSSTQLVAVKSGGMIMMT